MDEVWDIADASELIALLDQVMKDNGQALDVGSYKSVQMAFHLGRGVHPVVTVASALDDAGLGGTGVGEDLWAAAAWLEACAGDADVATSWLAAGLRSDHLLPDLIAAGLQPSDFQRDDENSGSGLLGDLVGQGSEGFGFLEGERLITIVNEGYLTAPKVGEMLSMVRDGVDIREAYKDVTARSPVPAQPEPAGEDDDIATWLASRMDLDAD